MAWVYFVFKDVSHRDKAVIGKVSPQSQERASTVTPHGYPNDTKQKEKTIHCCCSI